MADDIDAGSRNGRDRTPPLRTPTAPLRHTCGAMWASPPTNVLPKACALSMRRRAPQGYLSRFAPLRGHPPLHTSTGHIPHTQTKDRRMPVFCLLQIHFFIPPCRGPERQRHTARVDEHAQGCGKQKKQATQAGGLFGRGRKARTLDTRFWRPLLYQLSYTPMWWAFGDSNPGPDGYEPSALTN